MNRERKTFMVWRYVTFFLMVSFVVTCSFLLFLNSMQIDMSVLPRNAVFTFGNIAFLSGFLLLIDWLFRKWTVDRPVRRIHEATKRMTAGDLTARIDTSGFRIFSDDFNGIAEDFNLMAEVNYLNWPAGSTDNLPWFGEFALDETRYLDALEHIGGAPVNTPADIDRALDKFLHEALTGRCKVFASYLPIEFRYMPADAAECASAIARFRAAKGKDPQALQTLTHYVNWKLLEIMNDIGCTLQTAVGAEYFICGGRSLSRYSDTWVSDMVKVCYQFPNIEFDFMNASQAMNHEMEVAAKMIRNFHIQNMWWHTYVPGCMQSLSEKLEVVPAVKLGGFFCDAYYCELTYGKLQMVKDTLANVCADKVASGLYTEDYAVEVLKMLLNENQRALYRLD